MECFSSDCRIFLNFSVHWRSFGTKLLPGTLYFGNFDAHQARRHMRTNNQFVISLDLTVLEVNYTNMEWFCPAFLAVSNVDGTAIDVCGVEKHGVLVRCKSCLANLWADYVLWHHCQRKRRMVQAPQNVQFWMDKCFYCLYISIRELSILKHVAERQTRRFYAQTERLLPNEMHESETGETSPLTEKLGNRWPVFTF